MRLLPVLASTTGARTGSRSTTETKRGRWFDGSVWVSEYRRPGDEQPRWKIFNVEGVYLGVVETPPRFYIFEIGSDYLLGRWRDDLDVEHILLYELMGGTG